MNSLGVVIEPGTVVVLRAEILKPDYHELKWRLFRAEGGFGLRPTTIGTALIGTFLADGEKARMEGYHIERLATADDCPECPECGARALKMCDTWCSERWETAG